MPCAVSSGWKIELLNVIGWSVNCWILELEILHQVKFQEISNRTHWTDPEKPWVSNSSSNLLRGPLVRSHSIFDGKVGSFSPAFKNHIFALHQTGFVAGWNWTNTCQVRGFFGDSTPITSTSNQTEPHMAPYSNNDILTVSKQKHGFTHKSATSKITFLAPGPWCGQLRLSMLLQKWSEVKVLVFHRETDFVLLVSYMYWD